MKLLRVFPDIESKRHHPVVGSLSVTLKHLACVRFLLASMWAWSVLHVFFNSAEEQQYVCIDDS